MRQYPTKAWQRPLIKLVVEFKLPSLYIQNIFVGGAKSVAGSANAACNDPIGGVLQEVVLACLVVMTKVTGTWKTLSGWTRRIASE